MRDHTAPASPFGALALLATARAAVAAARRVADRRAGRDASAQEPEPGVRDDLAHLADRLASQALRLRLRALAPPEAPSDAARLALAFEDHALLADLAETAALAHQKLLSLYPAVAADLPEAARRLARDAAELAGTEALDAARARFAERASALADALRDLDA